MDCESLIQNKHHEFGDFGQKLNDTSNILRVHMSHSFSALKDKSKHSYKKITRGYLPLDISFYKIIFRPNSVKYKIFDF